MNFEESTSMIERLEFRIAISFILAVSKSVVVNWLAFIQPSAPTKL